MVVVVNKASFDKEVMKQEKPVVIDFYADWCVDPATEILTHQGLAMKAKEVRTQENLRTYNGKRMEKDNVVRSFTSEKLGHCVKIETESKRNIRVTDNHLFWTKEGWKEAEKLKLGEEVAVYPFSQILQEDIRTDKLILNEKIIYGIAKESLRIDEYVQELKGKELLPLKLKNKNMRILARMAGILFTDGNLYEGKTNNYREISFSLGQKEDVESVKEDLAALGFKKIFVKKQRKEVEINKRRFVMNVWRIKVCSTALWLLFRALGVPEGRKGDKEYEVPAWIREAPLSIKQEFMAAYLGGDGPKILIGESKKRGRGNYNSITINDIEFYKNVKKIKSGKVLASQIKEILEELNIKVRGIFVDKEVYQRKDGEMVQSIHIGIRNDMENAYNLFMKVGYRYCKQKEQESAYAAEFFRRILKKREDWAGKYDEVMRLHREKGWGYRRISSEMRIHPITIWNWIKKGVQPTIQKHHMLFVRWIKEQKEGLEDGLVWERIKTIDKIYLDSVQKIMMGKNYNFIANGFLSHNCGPCKMIAPILEELSKDWKDVKFVKLDTEADPELAMKFNVMSIPTLIVMRQGKEAGRVVGYMTKASLKEKLTSLVA